MPRHAAPIEWVPAPWRNPNRKGSWDGRMWLYKGRSGTVYGYIVRYSNQTAAHSIVWGRDPHEVLHHSFHEAAISVQRYLTGGAS